MRIWKKNIFVNAIKVRMKDEGKTAQEIIADYPALTEIEKNEILATIGTP